MRPVTKEQFKPGDKVIVRQYDGKTVHGTVVLVDQITSKVRVQAGEFVLNVSEEQVAKGRLESESGRVRCTS
jgi:hypothetical protein